MVVRVGERNAIILGRDSMYPPHIAFYLAHEIAHIALGHLADGSVLVDLESDKLAIGNDDVEEREADRFALEVLTGYAEPKVLPKWETYSARELARVANDAGPELGIEPGTLSLCFGYSTGDWATANAAIGRIYRRPSPVWEEINRAALAQLVLDLLPDDAQNYVQAILGTSELNALDS